MGARDRKEIVWNLSSFFVGEERVTTQFSGLVRAYETQGEEAFLTTQQVDEARHAQHFNRFYEQVVGYEGSFETRLERARDDLNPAFLVLFDEHLVDAQNRLFSDPADVEAKVDFVVTYHMLIEGTLALTGPELHHRGVRAPRHPARVPRGLSQDRPGRAPPRRLRDVVLEGEVHGPVAGQAGAGQAGRAPAGDGQRALPPGMSLGDEYEILGVPSDEVNEFAFSALSRRLKVIGVGLPAVTA